MSFQRRRQLNEEQTRIYAAGMNAARRGETQPKERLPPEQDWSITAASNGTADTLINWAEGQPRASVNNPARMAAHR